MQNSKKKTFRIPERHRLARFKCFGLGIRDIQTDRDRPKGIVLQAHSVKNRLIISPGHKAFER